MRIVFDASTLISLSQSCLMNIMYGLREKTGSEFFLPRAVYNEAVKRPITIRRFELNAVRIKKGIDEKWFKIADLKDEDLFREIDGIANNCFYIRGKPIKLIQKGEIEALAMIKELNADAFAIDERTMRMLIENPGDLKKILQARRRKKISVDMEMVKQLGEMFKDLTIIRSVELVALAYEHGILEEELPKGKQSLEAALFAAKYSGCAVSAREINRFLHKR